jgi:tetratricopeptide (TPR) repeat protein/transcriptional regulator with XRE-family HTH domain
MAVPAQPGERNPRLGRDLPYFLRRYARGGWCRLRARGDAVADPPVAFAGVLRKLRAEARLTQEELAEATGLSPRSISDLERGIASTPRRDTVRLLADALGLAGPARAEFEAAARGRAVPGGAGAAGAAAATRTLPRDIVSFTGRQQQLQDLVDAAASSGCVVGIHAIGGMAGIGKTAFAVHVAHKLAPRFPAGQIFLPLHGHTPGQRPVDPGEALASLLLTLGVPAAQIPPGVEARMALWRDRLAGRQLLLVLDDAASSEQVRPLLPGTLESMVLVTSRRHLSALEDATAISLDTLSAEEAAALLVRLAGRAGLSPGDPAAGEIIRLCGYLPLAIGMVARQLHHHPSWSLTGQAAELAAAQDRLELMATENLSVTAAFNLSYEDLTSDQQRLFRRLGLHPGTDIDAYAAAALDGTDLGVVRRGLEALYDHYLLTEPARGRYRLHDLIREHARALAGRGDPEGDRDRAMTRLLDYYQHTAAVAESRLAFQARPALACAATAEPGAVPVLPGREQALAWLRAERANLFGCLDHVTATGQHARVIALTFAVAGLLYQDGPWTEALTRQAEALHAAQRLGDRAALANVLDALGNWRMTNGDYPNAAPPLEEALGVYRDLGDRYGQAYVLIGIAIARKVTGNYPSAVQALEESLSLSREIGDRPGQAEACSGLGGVRQMAGDYPGAAQALEEALGLYRAVGERFRQAGSLLLLGVVRMMTGDYPGAAQVLEEALGLYRDFGNRAGQAEAHSVLGEVRRLAGDYPGAARALEEALDIQHERGYRLGEANARALLGALKRTTGDYPGAALALGEALSVYRDIGDRGGEVTTLNESGTLYRLRGELPQASSCHQQALKLAREMGGAWDEAHALAGLGRCALAAGHTAEADANMRQALEIFRQIGAAEVADLTAELDALTSA